MNLLFVTLFFSFFRTVGDCFCFYILLFVYLCNGALLSRVRHIEMFDFELGDNEMIA